MTYENVRKKFIVVLSAFTCFLHVGNFTFIPMESIKFFIWHLMLGMIFVFLYKPLGKRSSPLYRALDWLCICLTAVAGLYVIVGYENFIVLTQTGRLSPPLYAVAVVMILLVLETTRRVLGFALPSIAITTILYALYGGDLPGLLGHRGYNIWRVIATIFSDQGIYGTPIGVSATNVFLFLMFGAFLSISGAATIFQDLAIIMTGSLRGGPAKMAIVASGFFGMISGSAVANVVSTGSFTVPLMVRQGYSARFAGAVSAVASTGGQIMPPIMGAAAFVLADIAETPYRTVCLAAFLPAVMYYATLFKIVDLESVKEQMRAAVVHEQKTMKQIMKKAFKLFIPLAVLLFLLLVMMTTPMIAAIWSTAAIIACGMLDRENPLTLKDVINGFTESTKSMPQVVAACACAGIVTGMFALTGLGLKFSDFIVSLGGNNIFLSLILSMIICVILGMGLPTTASYIICATAIAPALVGLGIPKLSAHLFLLYFASISAITPPVAVASYAAASLADENAIKVGLTAVKLGIAGFVLPFVFTLNPDYLHFGFDLLTLATWISAFVVCISAAIMIQGYIEGKVSPLVRLLCLVIIGLAIRSDLISSLVGWALFAAMYWYGKKGLPHAAARQVRE